MKKQVKKLLKNTHFSKDLELCFYINPAVSNVGRGATNYSNHHLYFGESELLSQETDTRVNNRQRLSQLSKEDKDEIDSALKPGIEWNGIDPSDTKAIKAMQKALDFMGYSVVANGEYNLETVEAVEAFQKRVNFVLSQGPEAVLLFDLRYRIHLAFDKGPFRRGELPINGMLLSSLSGYVNKLNPQNENWKVFGKSKTLLILSKFLETKELHNPMRK